MILIIIFVIGIMAAIIDSDIAKLEKRIKELESATDNVVLTKLQSKEGAE